MSSRTWMLNGLSKNGWWARSIDSMTVSWARRTDQNSFVVSPEGTRLPHSLKPPLAGERTTVSTPLRLRYCDSEDGSDRECSTVRATPTMPSRTWLDGEHQKPS